MELSDTNTMYFDLDNLLDKTIKITPDELTTEESDETETKNITANDIKTMMDEIKTAFIDTLNVSELKKEYVDLEGEKVKKITLILDKNNVTYFCNELLNSNKFIDAYTKMTGETKEELEKEFDEMIDLYDKENEEISLYLSILKNEFLLFEEVSAEETFAISKEGDKYSFEAYTPSKIEFQGYVIISKVEDKNNLIFNLENPSEETSVEIDLLYKTGDSIEVDKLDTKNATAIDSLTEDDYTKLMEEISKNEAILDLLADLGLQDTSTSLNI